MISVIIPTFNSSKYIERAIKSAVNQEKVKEVIVVDDGSKDDTVTLVQKLKEEFSIIKLYSHPYNENKGAGATRNLGVQFASNKYITFLDSDDYYLDNRFKLDIEILENDKIDGVYSAIGVMFGDEVGRNRFKSKNLDETSLTTLKVNVTPETLFWEMGPIGSQGSLHLNGLTVKKSTILDVGGFNEELLLSQDTDLLMKISLVATIVSGNLLNPVALRCVHANNRVQDRKKLESYRPMLFESLIKFYKDKNLNKPDVLSILEQHYLKWVAKQSTNKFGKIINLFAKFKYYFNINFYKTIYRCIKDRI